MSGNAWLTLEETVMSSGVAGAIDPSALHDSLVAEITAGLGPAHAAVLARPAASGTTVAWQTTGADARRLAELPAESRRALLAALASILSDLRRLAEAGRSPTLARAWPALRQVSGLANVFAVDGRPVLTGWGHGGGDPLAAYDDGRRWEAPRPARWQPYAAAAAAVALFAGLAALALPGLARWAIPAPAMCQAEPAELDLMRRAADAATRGNALRAILATTNDDIGRKQLMCPLPVAAAAPPAEPAPPPPTPATPPPPPPPRAELPADKWDRHDLSILEGCWHSSTQLLTTIIATGQVMPVKEWRLCFDRSGHGQQTIIWADRVVCTGNQSASFREDNSMQLNDVNRCSGVGRNLLRGSFSCKRVSDNEATCARTQTEGQTGGAQIGRFTR